MCFTQLTSHGGVNVARQKNVFMKMDMYFWNTYTDGITVGCI